jgi:hypothetical protein
MTSEEIPKKFSIHEFSIHGNLLALGVLLALSAGLVLAIAWLARRSLAPYLELRPGHTPEEIRMLVGDPEYVTTSLSTIRDHSSTDSFSCQEAGTQLPSLLEPLFRDAGPNYGPQEERPLPEATGEMYIYFPFLFEVIIYLDNKSLMESVFLCHT